MIFYLLVIATGSTTAATVDATVSATVMSSSSICFALEDATQTLPCTLSKTCLNLYLGMVH